MESNISSLGMEIDFTFILISIIFGIIGLAYFVYGKKQNGYFAAFGIALMAYPYAIHSVFWVVLLGIVFTLAPFALTRFR